MEFPGAVYHACPAAAPGRRRIMARRTDEPPSDGRQGSPPRTGPHNQGRAEEMLASGLNLLGLQAKDLPHRPNGLKAKPVLARWLYGRTTVNRRWLTQCLMMGYETRISQAVPWVESSREPPIAKMKKKLAKYGL